MCAKNSKKEDLRITRTRKALKNTLLFLLNHRPFEKITVNYLCESAHVSRTAFYENFEDKYDLLKYSLDIYKKDLKKRFKIYAKSHTDKQIIAKINDIIQDNSKILANLANEANAELFELLVDIFSPDLWGNLSDVEKEGNQMTDSHVILTRFFAGGIANLVLWQIRNNFPVDNNMMTEYLYRMLKNIEKWDFEQE